MNAFENILIGLLQGAEATAPVFVHSQQGLLILNASETVLAAVLARFSPPATLAPPPAQPAV